MPAAKLHGEVRRWADEILALPAMCSLSALTECLTKRSAVGESAQPAFSGLGQFVGSEEAREGVDAFAPKRTPDFAPYRTAASA